MARLPEIVVLPAPATTRVWAAAVPPVPPEIAPLRSSELVVLALVSVNVPADPSPRRRPAAIVWALVTVELTVTLPPVASVRDWLPDVPSV